MASIEYSLFRAKFIKARQSDLFQNDLLPEQLFVRAVLEKPSAKMRRGYFWKIGNVRLFSSNTGYFAVGRTTKSRIEKIDATTGDFVEQDLDTSPYTHCVFNAALGILGIAKKSNLAPTVDGIAKTIQRLLSRTSVIRNSNSSVEIAPIPDPEGFIAAIDSAYRVSRFGATFHGPNPFDADELFQKPLSVYLASAKGKKGNAQIQGEDLDRDVLRSVTRSTVATGNQASATIEKEPGQKSITMHLKGDAVRLRYEQDQRSETVLRDLEELYKRVRQRETD